MKTHIVKSAFRRPGPLLHPIYYFSGFPVDGLHATLSPQRNIGRTVVNVSIRGADALLTSPGFAGFMSC